MNITLKPLTAQVTRDIEKDTASIIVKDERGNVILGPLTHHSLLTNEVWQSRINDHIAQLVYNGVNIVNIETSETGIVLPTQE